MHNKIITMKSSQALSSQRKKIGQYSYSAMDIIGKGYSSIVYRGVNDSNGQDIAIKLIDMKNIKGEVHKTLLNNEMEILRLLNNLQNIIKVYDILPNKAQTCIVTEICEGGDLGKIIKARKTLAEDEATSILVEIINGYRGINRFGIVHRDLKPANIFFNEGKVKIADFGFAIRNADLKKSSNYNVGSPVYMPIEALNDNLYSPKSDIWAIGVIFYEMLTGHTPWRAKTEVELKKQIKAISIKSLIPSKISRNASDFLLRALQVNVALRMCPEQMNSFFETNRGESNSFQSTDVSNSLRTNYLFRTRAMSHDRQDRPELNPISKNTVTAPKTFRKLSRVAGEININQKNGEFKTNFDKAGQTHFVMQKLADNKLERLNDVRLQQINDNKLGSLAQTVASIGQWAPDHKKTSSHLLSQIHLCRFFYKLIQRMSNLRIGSQRLKSMMSSLIYGKFNEVRQLKLINPRYALIFKRTKQFERILLLIEQYSAKYETLINNPNSPAYSDSEQAIDSELTQEIIKLYQQISRVKSPVGHEQQIILLDYLITMKQLLAINSNKDIEYFHKKSKIEAIVQGRPSKNITEDHLEAIIHKLKLFKVIV